jgi:manganese transport protein
VLFTRRRDIMGEFASGKLVQFATFVGAAIVLALNFVLLAQAAGLPIPFLPAG